MDLMMIIGAILIVCGVVFFTVAQILLYRWIKKFNKEWMYDNEVS